MLKGRLFIFLVMVSTFLCNIANAEQPENTEKYNVFAIVSPNIAKAVTRASNDIFKEEGLYSFPGRGYQVHCTLYMTLYPKDAIKEIDEKVAKIAKNIAPFGVTTNGLEITTGDWLFINLDKSVRFQNLADLAAKMLSPLRIKSDYIPEWAKNMPNKVAYITKYGSPNVFDEFNPHLTITAKEDSMKLKHFIQVHEKSSYAKPINGEIIAIGYGIADKNGQVTKPIKVYNLKGR